MARLTIVYRHYWPDTPPYAKMLQQIAGWLADAGHDVTVFTAQPSYKADLVHGRSPWREAPRPGVTVIRMPMLPEAGRLMPLRAVNAGLFAIGAFIFICWRALTMRRARLVWTASMPPVLHAMIVRWAAWLTGARFIYHCQDIYPEMMKIARLSVSQPVYRLMERLDERNVANADATVVLSADMKATLERRGRQPQRIEVINNFSPNDGQQAPDLPDLPAHLVAKTPGRFRIVFAGNVGRFQGLETVMQALTRLDPGRFEFLILGSGSERQRLQEMARELRLDTVIFEGHRPLEEVKPILMSADLGLVSILPDVYRVAYPSKTMAYLEAGCPVLALLETDSALAREIEQNNLGVACGERTPEAVAHVLESAAARKFATRAEIIAYYKANFGIERRRSDWVGLVAQLLR